MAEKDIQSEIEELKARLESLSRPGGQAQAHAAGAEPQRQDDTLGGMAGGWFQDVLKQAEELWTGLDLQLKDVPAKTALMIFALGVLTGRLLSRRE